MVTDRISRGKRILVIDFTYTRPDGSKGRYRRDAEVQTRAGAMAEERRRLAAVATKGSPFALVDEAAAKIEAEKAPPPPPASPTLGEVVVGFWKSYAPSRLKEATRHGYRNNLDTYILPKLGGKPVADITANVVRQFDSELAQGGMSRVSRRVVQIVLRSVVCRYAVEAGHLSEAPRMPKLPPCSPKLPVVISPDDAAKIIAAAKKPEHRLALLLAFHAGLRSCEIRGLRVCDVDLMAGVLRVEQAISFGVIDTPKSGKDRQVPLTAELREALAVATQGKDRNAFVSVSAPGTPWGQSSLRGMFVRIAQRAGIVDSTMHHMRHGFVTALLEQGVGVHVVKELAGHSDLKTTERYAHVLDKSKRAAIDALDALSKKMKGKA